MGQADEKDTDRRGARQEGIHAYIQTDRQTD